MPTKYRVHYLPADKYYNLDNCAAALNKAYQSTCYLVGSVLERPDYRDVDVRMIMLDTEFDGHFPGEGVAQQHVLSTLWCITCTSIGLWLSLQTGLAVDFQIQRMTQANKENPDGRRQPIGTSFGQGPNPADYSHTTAVSLGRSAPSSSSESDPGSPPPCSEQ